MKWKRAISAGEGYHEETHVSFVLKDRGRYAERERLNGKSTFEFYRAKMIKKGFKHFCRIVKSLR
ncbi:hypothetical protein [Metabacillus niabensis]|uniref:hypothetical protein n=1 Tax=Metabacillus niabensis TaxID=324854 RepID=UPI0036719E6E